MNLVHSFRAASATAYLIHCPTNSAACLLLNNLQFYFFGGCQNHRNLSTRTRMFELLLQTFWAKQNLVKSLLISSLDKVIYYNETFLQGSTKPFFTSQNRVETS
jgi:hypothetical protein